MTYPAVPPDLEPHERVLQARLAALGPVEPPAGLKTRVLGAAGKRIVAPRLAGRWAWAAAATVLLGLGLGIVGFARAAGEASACACTGASCREPLLEVVDDPSMPLYHTLETFTALDRGPGGGLDALADLGGGR